jgi:hypothetical protein
VAGVPLVVLAHIEQVMVGPCLAEVLRRHVPILPREAI